MKKTFKIISIVLGSLFALLIVGLIILLICLDSIVTKSVPIIGSELTGTKVTLENVSISILSPKIVLDKFMVGNPAGYNNPNAFELTKLKSSLERGSLMSDNIVINEVIIDGAKIDYELQLNGDSNLSDIQKNIEKKTKSTKKETQAAPEKTPEKGKKKTMLIKVFRMTNCKIVFTNKLLGGANITIPLPDIEMKDIGGKSSSPQEVMEKIYNDVFKQIVVAIQNAAGDLKLPEAFNKVSGGTKDALNKATEEGSKAINSLKNLF